MGPHPQSHCACLLCQSNLGIEFAKWAAKMTVLYQHQPVVGGSLVHGIALHIVAWQDMARHDKGWLPSRQVLVKWLHSLFQELPTPAPVFEWGRPRPLP